MRAPAPPPPGTRRALVVATGAYTDPAITRLRAPALDAQDMIEVLADADIGGFAVTSIMDRPEAELRRTVSVFLGDCARDDLVLIYLSCHGLLSPRGRLYFAATDTVKAHLRATAVEAQWLLEEMDECAARRQVLILDCCFSGAFAGKGSADLDLDRRLGGHGRGRAVLTASRSTEYSFEGRPLSAQPLPRSVFTSALVTGLRTGEADRDGDGYVSVEEAFAYAADRVAEVDPRQNPQRWLFGGEAEIILARSPRGASVVPANGLDTPGREPLPGETPVPPRSPRERLRDRDHGTGLFRRGLTGRVNAVTFSPDGRLLAAATGERVVVFDVGSGEPVGEPLIGHRHLVLAVRFTPDGRRLATGGADGSVRIWDAETRQREFPVLAPHTRWVRAVAFNPDGTRLAGASDDGAVSLWNLAQGSRPIPGPRFDQSLYCLAYSPDGRWLATGGADHLVHLCRPGRTVSLRGHADHVLSLAYHPDGLFLASGGRDRTVRLWDLTSDPAAEIACNRHQGWVQSVAVSPDGALIASACHDGRVDVYTATTLEPVTAPVATHNGSANSVAFSPDGTLLASGGDDGVVVTVTAV
ncbi:caspase family protein [Asanoa sp. NPDC049573]|uniref:caspase, EACC1-associated type n=1 Tax=Asanoa sp. NPDC049573 TaxID=3155396 RepID=UPI0034349DD6